MSRRAPARANRDQTRLPYPVPHGQTYLHSTPASRLPDYTTQHNTTQYGLSGFRGARQASAPNDRRRPRGVNSRGPHARHARHMNDTRQYHHFIAHSHMHEIHASASGFRIGVTRRSAGLYSDLLSPPMDSTKTHGFLFLFVRLPASVLFRDSNRMSNISNQPEPTEFP